MNELAMVIEEGYLYSSVAADDLEERRRNENPAVAVAPIPRRVIGW